MNWNKIVLAGVAGGVVVTIFQILAHGFALGSVYTDHPTFSQEQANPLFFVGIATGVGIAGAILFSRTRASWGEGWRGGATFGFFVGLTALFVPMYNSLVIEQFPYFLTWCWGGIDLVGWVLYGTVAALFIKN
jgi:hypothetical protein